MQEQQQRQTRYQRPKPTPKPKPKRKQEHEYEHVYEHENEYEYKYCKGRNLQMHLWIVTGRRDVQHRQAGEAHLGLRVRERVAALVPARAVEEEAIDEDAVLRRLREKYADADDSVEGVA